MRFRFLAALAAAVVAMLALSVGGGSAAPQVTVPVKVTKVKVTMTEYSFKLSRSVVPVGKVIFTVTNRGDIGHDFVIASLNKKTPVMNTGVTKTLTVTFKKKGKYLYLCSVGEHFLHGMKGNLTVR